MPVVPPELIENRPDIEHVFKEIAIRIKKHLKKINKRKQDKAFRDKLVNDMMLNAVAQIVVVDRVMYETRKNDKEHPFEEGEIISKVYGLAEYFIDKKVISSVKLH